MPSDADTNAADFLRLREAAHACTEAELLIKVKEDFSEEFWSRFYILADKLEEETMTVAENIEFGGYTDQTEAYTVVVYLIELGRRRGITALDLIKHLGLRMGETHLLEVEQLFCPVDETGQVKPDMAGIRCATDFYCRQSNR